MKKSRFTDERIISILKEHPAGASLTLDPLQRNRSSHTGRWAAEVPSIGIV
ncbi:hypothetical protein G5V57_31370 [Nordella sp. HKS 07]|uniref:hypothetical protein n=1 Tax=Nordella sp. HKS 07 TaxID=2712222 RepID=UPI0013E1B274|nr:hypothetical protein [Nordella sp. HKS 07]QIG51815.1 hypothetical protein G5V57_31370 [Nordella sp. HKS 07]